MNKLIRKSIIVNRNNSLVGIIISLFFATIFIEGTKYYTVALLMCPALLFSFIVGKICYIEDGEPTYQFLMALPITKRQLIQEKNILSWITIALGLLIAHIGMLIFSKIIGFSCIFNIRIIVSISVILVLYNTIYLFLNYRFDYSKTQFAPYVMMVFMLILFRYGNKFQSTNTSIIPIVVLFLLISIINIIIFYFLDKKIFGEI